MTDPMQFMIDLFEDEWDDTKTDGITPTFAKITDYKRYDYGSNSDAIFIHRSMPLTKPSGFGTAAKDQFDNLQIDIRVLGTGQEAHWEKVVTEAVRIMDANIVNPGGSGDYGLLNPDSQRQDLSDKLHNLWRIIIPIQLINYTKAR